MGMGAPVTGMAPSAASIQNRNDRTTLAAAAAAIEAAAPARASPQDLCVDCFRGGEQLVTALLDCRFFAKARSAAPLSIAGWHMTEPMERRRGSFGSGEEGGGGERRRRNGGVAATEEAVEPFQHHADAEAYIREYRRQRDLVMEATMRKSRKKENDASGNSLLIIERVKLIEENAKASEQKSSPQRPNEKEKENNRTAKQVTVVQIITAETQLQMQPMVEDMSPGNSYAMDFLSDCYNVQRVGGVYPQERQRSAEDPLPSAPPSAPSRLPASDFLSPCRFNCLSGRKIAPPPPPPPPPPATRSESPPPAPAANTALLTEKGLGSAARYRHQPRAATVAATAAPPPPPPPPSAEPKGRRSREDAMLGRCTLVLPQISQDLCASFRPETQIEDVKRLKDARRSRSFQHQHHQQQQQQQQQQHNSKLRVEGDPQPHELSPRRRETATAPQEGSSAVPMPLPWSSLVLARRPKTRPRLVILGTDSAECGDQADVKKRSNEIFSSYT